MVSAYEGFRARAVLLDGMQMGALWPCPAEVFTVSILQM